MRETTARMKGHRTFVFPRYTRPKRMKTGRCGMIDDGHDHLLPDALLLGSGRKVDRIFGRVAIAHTPTERKSSGKAHDRIVHIGDEKGKALGLTLSDQVSDLCHCLFLGVE